ncbi:DNA polymerase-4 [Thermoactinomyces sp. DSM 45891]|uniref:DNA polymerase IV n=1 Tax=Thermoactinomyces sp. DSM 45891 TaxID=1761907 RepID=UPI00091D891A|nr:DNA polymerase IV [Thermoactinomyces sp. DSM 45891]SFX07221.1 DNA polymerase-4 [Thermoactinomyces sp. DSM 45891]
MILLIDCESFYCSVEKAMNPNLWCKPTIVCGDPVRRSGIVLAACPIAKLAGVKTTQPLWEALQHCPDLTIIRPRMQLYIDVSLKITCILERFSDRVEIFSIDEAILDISGCTTLFGSPREIAQKIQNTIQEEVGIRARVGIGSNKLLAKVACDSFAKKNFTGIYTLNESNFQEKMWPLPIGELFGVGSRMKQHLQAMRIITIGHLANYPLERLKAKWGVNGHVIWMSANGIDYSPVVTDSFRQPKDIGHSMTLPRDYKEAEEVETVLLELVEEVCRRMRSHYQMGRTVHVGVRGADFDRPTGFHRQISMPDPTNESMRVFEFAKKLLHRYWDRGPVRAIGLSLSQLQSDEIVQLDLFDRRAESRRKLDRAVDEIKDRYGKTSIIRASSLTGAGQVVERAGKIGGHYR